MAIKIGRFTFEGPFRSAESLEGRSGVYAILTFRPSTGRYRVLDIGESADVHTRVSTHDRADDWLLHAEQRLFCAALYTTGLHQSGRCAVEQELRARFRPPCGER